MPTVFGSAYVYMYAYTHTMYVSMYSYVCVRNIHIYVHVHTLHKPTITSLVITGESDKHVGAEYTKHI